MSTYVLIHGAWHGSWCWDKVVSLLKQAGHTAIAPDLPGHGKDKTPIPEITLQGYVQRVCETVNAQVEPVILVGHSMGGGVITQAAEECPDKLKMLFICALFCRGTENLCSTGFNGIQSPCCSRIGSSPKTRAIPPFEVTPSKKSSTRIARMKMWHGPDRFSGHRLPLHCVCQSA